MKKFEFESNGAKWLLLCANNRDDYYLNTRAIDNPNGRVGNGVSLCKITEVQASEVVDVKYKQGKAKCYFDYCKGRYTHSLFTAIESLHSLLKSKGIHLYKNPYRDDWEELCIWGHGCFAKDGKSSFELFTEAEAKTFYNPVLFKILP